MSKLFIRLVLFIFVLLLAFMGFKTLMFSSKQIEASSTPAKKYPLPDSAEQRLSSAIQIPSVTNPFSPDTASFQAIQALVDSCYPAIKLKLIRTTANRFTLIYRWKGKNPELKPVLIMAHQDVVPVAEETMNKWTKAPFSGTIAEGHIWGRGTLDDKSSMFAILESVELLLQNNYQPERDLYFVFGHDEETGGKMGAKGVAEAFKQQGLRFAFVLDEGMTITQGMMPGIDKPVAFIGIGEKGYATYHITAKAEGGHSSMPGNKTAIGMLAKGIASAEQNPMPARMDGPVKALFDYVGPEMALAQRFAFANRWLLKGLIRRQLAQKGSSNALIRTTAAFTMIQGGVAENVLPTEAKVTVNFRIRPGETVKDVEAYLEKHFPKSQFSIEPGNNVFDPPPLAKTNSYGFELIQTSIKQVFPEVITAPSLMPATTDSRHFSAIADDVYKFAPMLLTPEDLKRFHGIDERISVAAYHKMIEFYTTLLQNAGN